MDIQDALDSTAEFLGLSTDDKPRKTRKKRAKKESATSGTMQPAVKSGKAVRRAASKRRVGRPAKAAAPVGKPRKLPKTKLLSLQFRGDDVVLTFRDLRKLTTPLKYLDRRLPKLAPKQLRQAEISRNGKTVAWAEQGILVEVSYALHLRIDILDTNAIIRMRPVKRADQETAYVVWDVQHDTPRFGAGVFRTRAEAEAVAGHSMARGNSRPGELTVKPLVWAKPIQTLH